MVPANLSGLRQLKGSTCFFFYTFAAKDFIKNKEQVISFSDKNMFHNQLCIN